MQAELRVPGLCTLNARIPVPSSIATVKRALGDGTITICKGVAKLGYAWEATHVRIFAGEAELSRALVALCTQPGCEAPTVLGCVRAA